MTGGHVLSACQRLDVQWASVLAIDPIAHPPQSDQLGESILVLHIVCHIPILASDSVCAKGPSYERTTMDTFRFTEPGFLRSVRLFLAIAGAITLIAGIVLLIWPAKSAVIVTGIFASYLIIGGLVYLGLAVFSGRGGGWVRAGHVVLGLLYVVTGVVAFANLTAATVTLAIIVAIFIGVSWIADGVVALSLMGHDASRAWTLLYALLGIVAGITVLLSPLYAATVLWLILGVSLVALGVVQLVRAFTLTQAEAVQTPDVLI